MEKCGLLGGKLGHSFSPLIHSFLGRYSYELYEKTPEELEDFIKNGDYTGLNVTIPYKKDVIKYCNKLSYNAKRIGSVNTLIKSSDGTIFGDNTDYYGLKYSILNANLNLKDTKVLILGDGGVSLTARVVAQDLGAKEIIVVSRRGEVNYTNIYDHSDSQIIINATPVGMYPNNGERLIDLTKFKLCKGVVDLIYNPSLTRLLLDAKELNISTVNGLVMLVAQAKKASELFTSRKIPNRVINKVVHEIQIRTLNIALIGMPGVGKSSVARRINRIWDKEVIDLDALIEERSKMTIPEIFEKYGEEKFREIETEVLADVSRCSGKVIATGGGIVTQQRNYDLLRQNSIIVYIYREIDELPTEGRPLSKINSLKELEKIRKPLYEQWCDYSFYSEGVREVAFEIKKTICRETELF
ncbi:MAG: shikimate kinase [Lachnospiraceae bacterium]|nr:shikimate kinase [Lachnospiraceae bacterium]